MFSPKIVCSDAFLDMPTSSRELYFQLGMRADDDGFVNPRSIMRMCGASEDDLKMLLIKRFVLQFDSGVIVLKHWKINNLIRKDWFQETVYLEEKKRLITKENGAYTDSVNNSLTEYSLGKVNILSVPTETPVDVSTESVPEITPSPNRKKTMYTYHPIEDGKTPKKEKKNEEVIRLVNLFQELGEKSTGVKPDITKGYFKLLQAMKTHGLTGEDVENLYEHFFRNSKLTPEQHVSFGLCISGSYITQWKVSKKNRAVSQVEASSEIML